MENMEDNKSHFLYGHYCKAFFGKHNRNQNLEPALRVSLVRPSHGLWKYLDDKWYQETFDRVCIK